MELEKAKELNYKEILQNEEVKAYLEKGNENLGILGYTDHSEKHCAIVAKRAGKMCIRDSSGGRKCKKAEY